MTKEAHEQFHDAMKAAGLDVGGPIVADGKHRFNTSGDRQRNSWNLLHVGLPNAGTFNVYEPESTS